MQEALLVTAPRDARFGGKAWMFVSMLLGFVAAVVLLRPVEEPAISTANVAQMGVMGGTIASHSFPRFANQLRQPRDSAAFANPRKVVCMTTEEECAVLKLQEAIKVAKECKGPECLVEWDNVEELSAAVAHAGKKSTKTEAKMSEAELQEFKTLQAEITEARKNLPKKEEFDSAEAEKVLADIEAAAAKMESVVVKFSQDEMSQIEAKVQEAIKEAEASKSAVDWEIVEELMAQRSHLKKFGSST